MKVNEIRPRRQINEVGRLASLIGGGGAAMVKQFANRFLPGGDRAEGQLSVADKEQKEDFINNLFSAAAKSLQSELASGRVDPNIKGLGQAKPEMKPAEPPTQEPAAPQTQQTATQTPQTATQTPQTAPQTPQAAQPAAKQSSAQAGAAAAAQRQTNQNMNNYIQGLSKSLNAEKDKGKKIALAKELVNYMADRKDYPEWQNAMGTATQIIKKGVGDPNFSAAAINKLKSGQMMEAWQIYWLNKLLENVGLTFKDIGLTLLKESKKNGKYQLRETKYYKLNNIFESIMLSEAESVAQWLNRFLPQYLNGIPVTDPNTQKLIVAAGDSYDPKNPKAWQNNLLKVANSVYAIAQAPGGGQAGEQQPQQGQTQGGTQGAQAQQAQGQQAAPQAQQAQGQQAAPQTQQAQGASPQKTGNSKEALIATIQSSLTKLKSIDPAAYTLLIKDIGSGKSITAMPGNKQTPGYDDQTGEANAAMKAQNKAQGKAVAPQGFDTETGKPNPVAESKRTMYKFKPIK